MTLANLRGILHRGVGAYLDYLRDNPDPLQPVRLLDDLDRGIRREDAVRRLEIVLQAVIENYEEYKDYNTTTTQSDYGENLSRAAGFLASEGGLRAARLAVPAAGAGPRSAGAARPRPRRPCCGSSR